MMLLLYLSLIVTVSFYHGCNAGVSVLIGDKTIQNGDEVEVSPGGNLTVTCSTNNENETALLVSSNNTVNITVVNNSTLNSEEYLVHNIMKESHNSVITCHDNTTSTYFYLNVTYVPEITLSQDSYLKEEGINLTIPINISANPPVESVHWYMNGAPINDMNVMTSDDSIMFQDLDRTHGGNYSVQGHNSKGDGDNATFLLTVYFDIEFAASDNFNESNMTTVELHEGEMYTINCSLSSVGSHPPNTTVHIQQSNGSLIYNESEMNITASRDTYYLCVANNVMETAYFNYSIIVIPATTPSPSPTSSPMPSPTRTPGAGYTVTVSFGLVIIAIVLSFFVN
ncbi:PREDICTED: uncharacterized protein LOC105312831 [Amphimedon queenslandica]|uniref:Ig-like domain-containing protein n=1 Tax=Amphimedon queenslandica TaxID=400682 RepID=A0A1X7UU76_AMPQE|nr:PREDICTED: uncharacterized protein LOC105312831 [Amphimedon queenslandica]|eukprot:XP_011404072.2 PREDICTED: uncharacterized protein LOC105312831 [Amphimedon queenslandica]